MTPFRAMAALLLAAAASGAHAYGPEGHALIAFMAQSHLQPAALAQVRRLLLLDPSRASGLDEISSWADDWRSGQPGHPETAHPETGPFHFVDIPLATSAFDEARDCHFDKDNKPAVAATCVIAKIPEFFRILADSNRGDGERLVALKYLVHLVGDIHQPFHTVDNMDRGGNGVGLVYFGEQTNLHAVWDGGIIEKQYGWVLGPNFSFDHAAVGAAARDLDLRIGTQQRQSWRLQSTMLEENVVHWAIESHQLAAIAYVGVPAVKWTGWEGQYQAAFWPVVREQLQKASVRLASLLNLAFGAADDCPSAEGFPAFYIGPYVGPEDKLAPADFARDFYCAALFRNTKYPRGFIGVYGSSAIENKGSAADIALYAGVRDFAQRWSRDHAADYPVLTGAGPGLMRAANEGAMAARAPSIGYTTYYDARHDYRAAFLPGADGRPIITDGLIFTSDAARESMMLAHSSAIVVAPGGSGTGWEIFQALDTLRNKQLSSVPMLLVGDNAHWYRFCDFIDDMDRRGTLPRARFDAVVTRVEKLEDVQAVLEFKLGMKKEEPAGMSVCTPSAKQ